MKRFTVLFCIGILVLLCGVSCREESFSSTEGEKNPQTEQSESPVSTEERFDPPKREDRAEKYPEDLSAYITLPEHLGVKAPFADPSLCSDAELEEAIFQIRLAVAKFEKKTGTAERYDKVVLDFELILDTLVQEEYAVDDLEIVIGSESTEEIYRAMASALVSASVGDVRYTEYTYPESVLYGEMSGKTVVLKGSLKEIHSPVLPELTEEFIHSLKGFEGKSEAEFRESVKKSVLESKEEEKVERVWAAFLEGVVIHSYPEEVLNLYRDDHVSYYKAFAEAMKMDYESFLAEYIGSTAAEIEAEAVEYAKEMVKNDMVFLRLSQILNITLTEEEFRLGAEEYRDRDSAEFESLEEFIEYYSESIIRRNLIWDKALMVVVDNAVSTVAS